jgi:hypothetical protein
VIRQGLREWLQQAGFKRLGSNGWARSGSDGEHHIIAVQCGRSGWDPRTGNRFIIEFERSRTPSRATGFSRQRLWDLLDEPARREALEINDRVAQTLPPPDQRFVRELPDQVREHYLRSFAATTRTVDSTDVWFAYYDEHDAAIWADFVSRRIEPALHAFLAQPPSFHGHRPPASTD